MYFVNVKQRLKFKQSAMRILFDERTIALYFLEEAFFLDIQHE